MPDIKLKNNSGAEQVYTGVDTITVPLADGSGTWTFGLTDEDLAFTDGQYLFYKNRFANNLMKPENRKRIKFKTDEMVNTFSNSDWDDLSDIEITFLGKNSIGVKADCLSSCPNLTKLPVITNELPVALFGNQSPLSFSGCYSIQEEEIIKWLNHFTNNSTFQNPTWFQYCYSLRHGSWFKDFGKLFNYQISSWYATMFGYCFGIEDIGFPVLNLNYETTSNLMSSSSYMPFNYCARLNDFTFATQENGTPYTVKWKNQTYDFSYNPVGYKDAKDGNFDNFLKFNKLGITEDKNILYGYLDSSVPSNIAEIVAARYQELKDDPDWFACSSAKMNYNGSSYNIALLYSRYNHDSAVRTINSLPDTSAYLATAGGTNTIKFKGVMGALTDGGAINTLTEEEIAVAAAKGWTVTLV